ncbi:MAG: hypothetical protein MZW92_12420 [Comamonadaceae bacterium]|nr:hypothetical protein [Comamonadaceae bacterium]
MPVQDYLARATFREGVKLGVLITQYFEKDWLGGSQTLKQALAAVRSLQTRLLWFRDRPCPQPQPRALR